MPEETMVSGSKKSYTIHCLLFFAVLSLNNCSGGKRPEEQVVARVANRVITVKHLQLSFALEPKWGAGLTKQQALQNQLDYLIDEKLFALHALELGLNKDEDLAGYLNFIADKELIKALYQQVVEEKVTISDEEYEQAYLDSKKKVRFNYVFSKNPDRAQAFFNQLKMSSFDSIRIDERSGEKKGTTRLTSFGAVSEEIEAFVFAMKPGEVHEPIVILDGYLVIQLVDGISEKFISETDFAVMKNQLRKIIYLR